MKPHSVWAEFDVERGCHVFRCEHCQELQVAALLNEPEFQAQEFAFVVQVFRFRTCAQVRMRKALG